MKPNAMDIAQIIHAGLPTVAAMAPIENNTSAGTPLATQNAPCQPIFLCNVSEACPACEAVTVFALNLFPLFLKFTALLA